MLTVFLSHSSKDKEFVRQLKGFLGSDFNVWLDEEQIAPGDNIVRSIADGLEADFVLLILSPDSVASKWVGEEWTDAFWEQTNRDKIKLIPILYRDCNIPRFLRNKKYFDLRTNHPAGFREIKTFLLTQRPAPPTRINQLPVRPPIFIGREAELADLRSRLSVPGSLVHIPGLPGRGKTTLALEFAHRNQHDFEAVHWLSCQSQNLAVIAADLQRQLGLKIEGDLPTQLAELKSWCAQRRYLLILDNVEEEPPGDLIPGGATSVIVTTRRINLKFLRARFPINLPLFTEEECFEVFRQQLGIQDVANHQEDCKRLFTRLGHLPFAVTLAAALIHEDTRCTIQSLSRDNLPEDVTDLIQQAIAALNPISRQLLAAMSACAQEGFYLDLASEIAGLDEPTALNALHQLMSRSLTEELSRDDRRYRLHALVRECAEDQSLLYKHAEAIAKRFERWETDWRRCEAQLPDLYLALEWALIPRFEPAVSLRPEALAYHAYGLTRRVGRLAESIYICERMSRNFERQSDKMNMQVWLGNLALILQDAGSLAEALALHEHAGTIFGELGYKHGLQTSYGNQAGILMEWGQFDEAMLRLKKQEAICEELADKGGLSRSYGNQALILKERGKLDDALALLKKQEAICEELGNKDGLSRSYGNQALICKEQGRQQDALALHKKEEAIWQELGAKADLAYCYLNWGLLNRELSDPLGAHEKITAALTLFEELKMPRGIAAVRAELEQPRAASAG